MHSQHPGLEPEREIRLCHLRHSHVQLESDLRLLEAPFSRSEVPDLEEVVLRDVVLVTDVPKVEWSFVVHIHYEVTEVLSNLTD